ncbi:MAG: YggW family oxidoreductase [Candidatus Muproteobacteria bacterium RBG_19FT_COMBO_61_10]|uniref:Heme chaperone HemW n=1 Tax=Candidatus Muproteobacteria bacterium RBG_19FT_COMBO_61_10 TaxID=1817761 RepID=A0A1F6UFD5_9PROT|nr:MAG: YggW family oxidoreductase [Candidatus Muproteobacteria bacterium RBG_19FT_COMBO_61_10]
MFQFTRLPPLSLYIHLPWCVKKCPYCDFNSHALKGNGADSLPQERYIDALIADLEYDLPRVWGRPVHSVFFGGGTPSLFSPASIDRLLAAVRARLPLRPDAEITLEANPGTVELARFQGYRAAGVNRLSIGIQSFNAGQLRALGRVHGRDEALRAATAARAAGFDNFNLDLMFGLPNQTPEEARADLQCALDLSPAHLSLYQLTIEPNTLFHAQPPRLPDDDRVGEMQAILQEMTAAAGFEHYEISAYARAGQSARHNLNYWRFGDYLGIGAGAHAKLTDASGISRLWKTKQPAEYMHTAGSAAAIGGEQRLTRADAAFDFMLNALRLSAGFEPALFQERTAQPLSLVEGPMQQAEAKGLILRRHDRIQPTEKGLRFLNDLLCLFLPETDAHKQPRQLAQ